MPKQTSVWLTSRDLLHLMLDQERVDAVDAFRLATLDKNSDKKLTQELLLDLHRKTAEQQSLVKLRVVDSDKALRIFHVWHTRESLPSATDAVALAGPPKAVENFLWFLLPRKTRDAVMGDAEEAFRETLGRGLSRRAASFDYAKEAVFAILFALSSPLVRVLGFFRKSS
jgi:hypothetical protein